MYYQNVRGLRTKLLSLRCSVPMFLSYAICILTETWLTADISDAELGFNNFNIFRLYRNPNNSLHSRDGGVLIAIKSSFTSSPVSKVYLMLSKYFTSLLIGSTQLPPSCSLSVIESNHSLVDHLPTAHKPNSVIIFGDYNFPSVS